LHIRVRQLILAWRRPLSQTFKRKNQKPLYEAILKVKEGNSPTQHASPSISYPHTLGGVVLNLPF
jgi:hypothetical protein